MSLQTRTIHIDQNGLLLLIEKNLYVDKANKVVIIYDRINSYHDLLPDPTVPVELGGAQVSIPVGSHPPMIDFSGH